MRKFSKFFAIIFAMVMASAFIACSDGSSSDDGSNTNTNGTSAGTGTSTAVTSSTYRGVMTSPGETVYIDFIFTDGTNWHSQGYTDNTFATTTQTGTTTGTYSISGTTITINMPLFNATLTGTTSDDWATIVCSGNQLFTGTLTKQ